jgi:riboflavin kinase/FMN adenylyltransferase
MPDPVVIAGLGDLTPDVGRLFVVVGVFDGLHRGHAFLVRTLVREARSRGARSAVITFDHHPDEIIRGAAPPLLLDPAERIARLGRAGVEAILVMHFDDELRHTSYVDFVDALLVRTELAGFLMTSESAFGYERRGTPDALRRLGRDRGFGVVVIEPLTIDGEPVRSATVRHAIGSGDLQAARRLLGRPVAVTGDVDSDRRRRVTFRLPVALPPDGSYRTVVSRPIDGAEVALLDPRRRTAMVMAGEVELTSAAPADGRVRVAFRS